MPTHLFLPTSKAKTSARTLSGFTLIELIVVIVILGILAATAMPKFVDMRRQARIAALQSLEGGLKSSISLTQAAYILQKTNPLQLPNGEQVEIGDSKGECASVGVPVSGMGGLGVMMSCVQVDDGSDWAEWGWAASCQGFTAYGLLDHCTPTSSSWNSGGSHWFPPNMKITSDAGDDNNVKPRCYLNYRPGLNNTTFSITIYTSDC